MSHILKKILPGILILSIFLLSNFPVYAGSSSLSKWDSTGAFHLVVSLKWTPTAADKTKLETAFKLFAKDVYTMTEGKHTLKTLYVYTPDPVNSKAREWSKADIQFENINDLASAVPNGFTNAGGRIMVEDDLSDINEVGHALAHELGHYAYGLYDEYSMGTTTLYDAHPHMPHSNDNEKNTLMGSHVPNRQFSLDADYSSTTQKNAQWRMNEESAWATLTRDPLFDVFYPRLAAQNSRYDYPDLNSLLTPTVLTEPTTTSDVDIVWMEGSEVVVIIDQSGSMDSTKIAAAKSGAKSYLDKVKVTDYGAVVTFSSSVSTLSPLALLDTTTRTAYKSSIDGITAGGNTAIGSALRRGLTILNTSTRKGTFKYIVLLTDGKSNAGESPTGSILTDLKSAGYPVFSIGLGSGADMGTLNTISSTTNGRSYFAATGATLNAIYSNIQGMTSDDKLVGWVKDNLNISKPSKAETIIVDTSSKKAVFTAAFPSVDTMGLVLTMPDGSIVDSTTIANYSNINYTNEAGYIIYEVTDPTSGAWQMTLTSSTADTTNSEVILEAKTDSDFALSLEVTGGTYPAPMLLTAIASRILNITGLTMEATVTDTAGVVSTVEIKDDGISPDVLPNDGIYAGAFTNYTNGEYTVSVKASNPAGTAEETPEGVLTKKGPPPPKTPITENINLAANATLVASGFAADDHGSDFAGGTALSADSAMVAGKIDTDGDVDYFFFDATSGNQYTIYTSGLFPGNMMTVISLFDSDQSTLLSKNISGNQGGASNIIWTTPLNNTYYLTVAHGNGTGTGNYSVGIKPTQSFDKIFLGNIDTISPGSTFRVDGHDLYVIKKAFGAGPQDTNWNAIPDLDGNSIIDGDDLAILAVNFGK